MTSEDSHGYGDFMAGLDGAMPLALPLSPELHARVADCERRGDHAAFARLMVEHPEMVAIQRWTRIMHSFARGGKVEFVRAMLDAGVDVNLAEDEETQNRALFSAVSGGSAETVRLLLERGSDVNWGWGGGPVYSSPLALAAREGRIDIVRMLVEAGAKLDVIDRAGSTPLGWAVAGGDAEVIAYLRSKGAVLPHETPGYVEPPPPPPAHPIDAAVGAAAVMVFDETFAQEGGLELKLGAGPGETDGYVLYTRGMSARVMTVPPGGEAYSRAELAAFLPDVHSTVPEEWPGSEFWWVAEWMLRLSRWPFDHGTWLNGKWSVVSNEDPPRPLSESTEMTCWLMLGEKEPLARAELPGGESVCFYTLMPIHTAERDLALREGVVALLRLFAEHDVPEYLDPGRPSVV